MTAVTLACPLCAGNIQVDTSLAGQQVACPLCHGALMLPPAEVLAQFAQPQFQPPQPGYAPPYSQQPTEQTFTFGCPACSNPLQVTAAISGQQVACPYCATPIIVPPLQSTSQHLQPTADAQQPAESTPPADYDLASLLPPGAELPPCPTAAPAARSAPAMTSPPQSAPSQQSAPTSKPREPSAADRLPPTRSGSTSQRKADDPPASAPPSADRFPPSRPATPLANDRFPPGMGGPKPRDQKPAEPARDERYPPRQETAERREPAEKVNERLPPPRHAPDSPTSSPPLSKPPVVDPPEPTPAPAIDDLLPPGILPPGAESLTLPTPSLPLVNVSVPIPSGSAATFPSPSQVPQPSPDIDAILPPGMLPPGAELSPPPSQPAAQLPSSHAVDHLLPPGAVEVNTAAVGQPISLPATSLADSLLPPGAMAGPTAGTHPGAEVPLPKSQGPLRPVLAPGQSSQPQGLAGLNVEGREKEEELPSEIKKLSPEEKARRRFRRNAVMITVCLVILFAVFYYMAQ